MVKSLTAQELLYRSLVTKLICCGKLSDKEKNFRLANFWNQAEYFYDIFCESAYIMMTDDTVDALSIDDSGYARFDIIVLNDDFYVGFELLSKDDIQPDVDDVIVYIDLALSRLDSRLKKHTPSHCGESCQKAYI